MWLGIIVSLIGATVAFSTFVAICVQAWIYYGQLQQMEQSTKAATKAAKAAEDSVTLARETARIDQRAWVSTFNVPISDAPKDGEKWRIQIPFRNSGKTFARHVDITGGLHFVRTGNKPDFAAKGDEAAPAKDLLLPPNGGFAMGFITDVLWSDEKAGKPLLAGEWLGMFWGKITYYDIFNCPHWTIYCFTLNPKDWTWSVYDDHNDADNDRCDEVMKK